MDNAINRDEEIIKEIERKAAEEFQAVKLTNDSYIIPTNIVNTNIIESKAFKKCSFYKDEELMRAICELEVKDNDFISVTFNTGLEGDNKVLEIANLTMNTSNVKDVVLESDLNHEERKILITMIAEIYKEYRNVNIIFYVHYNFEMIKELVSINDIMNENKDVMEKLARN